MITRFDHPASLDAPGMFVLRAERDVWAKVLRDKVGDADMGESAGMAFAWGAQPQYHRHVRLVASDVAAPTSEGDVLGVATLDLPMADNPRLADLGIVVDPERRGEGIGSALHDAALALAHQLGRTTVQSRTWEPARLPEAARAIEAETGTGCVAADSPETRFLTRHGYVLGQVERLSRLHLPAHVELCCARDEALAAKPTGYDTIVIHGRTPEEFLADVAMLNATMASDVPTGAMDLEDEVWDAMRVRASEDQWDMADRDQLQTLVRHAPSGRLVGFTRLFRDRSRPRVAHQWDTLVVGAHRGRGLGMLMKVVNHAAVSEFWPEVARLITGNASENVHMLAINTALGYEPYAATGFWELRHGALS